MIAIVDGSNNQTHIIKIFNIIISSLLVRNRPKEV